MSEDRYEALKSRNIFNEIMTLRDQQRTEAENGEVCVEGVRLPWELTPQGYIRWYIAPTMNDLALKTMTFYVLRVPAHGKTGKQQTPGGQIVFVWKGAGGYSIIDGDRHPWTKWDLVQIPLRPDGCVVQHFNDSDEDIELLICATNNALSLTVDRGCGLEQLENCPEFEAANS